VLAESLRARDVTVDMMRVVDADIPPGVESDLGEGDDWPGIRQQILDAEILVIATPTWLGSPASKLILERIDAMLSEQDDEGRPVAHNHVAGVVCAGNEDGAPPRDHRDQWGADRHRLHRAGPVVDLLERRSRTRAVLSRGRSRQRLRQLDVCMSHTLILK